MVDGARQLLRPRPTTRSLARYLDFVRYSLKEW